MIISRWGKGGSVFKIFEGGKLQYVELMSKYPSSVFKRVKLYLVLN